MTTTTETPTMTVTLTKSNHPRKWGYYEDRWVFDRTLKKMVQRGQRWVAHRRGSDRPDGPSIVYVSVTGETILEQLETRRTRPYAILRPIVEDALRVEGITFDKLRWSQTAGCSCPCSPGFQIIGGPRGQDWWIEVTNR